MSRILTIAVTAGVLLLLTAKPALAQGTSANVPRFVPYWRQPITPYLDLSRGGSPALNYFLGTIPEQERRNNFGYLNGSLMDLENRPLNAARELGLVDPITAGVKPVYGATGPFYANTGGYFANGGPRFGVVPQPKIGEPVTRGRPGAPQ
jgi:hypothetical protein